MWCEINLVALTCSAIQDYVQMRSVDLNAGICSAAIYKDRAEAMRVSES